MAQYKVPQDVEADDKLLGPFSFRQFLYLLIAAGLIALAVVLFRIFPLLAIIPLPFVLLLIALALPLKKDQPMETYLAAVVSYYLKPRTRLWLPGQKESTIKITVPKKITTEEHRSKNITGEEATHRLSFLADLVDSEGRIIQGQNSNIMRDDLVAEANSAKDIFDDYHFNNLGSTIAKDENTHHEEVVREMRDAIKREEEIIFNSPAIILPNSQQNLSKPRVATAQTPLPKQTPSLNSYQPPRYPQNQPNQRTVSPNSIKSSIIDLANNPDFSISTIAKEAKRIKGKEEGEIFISLH